MEARTHVAALFLALFLLTGAAQAQQPWEWRTPAVPGKTYPTKSAAAAAMRAAHPAFANLTIEQGPEIGGSEQVFTYTGPDIPAEITPWTYASHVVRSTYHATEQEAKDATLAKLAVPNGSCPPPSIAGEGNWTPLSFFSQPPISQHSNQETKGLVVKTWVRSATVPHPCLDGNVANVPNFLIHRYRYFECQGHPPYYANSYNPSTGQGNIWSCFYTVKSQVTGNLLTSGCHKEGNPCDVRTGDKSQAETDYRSPTLTFTRTYHSLAQGERAELGIGWSHNYSDRLSFNGASLSGFIYGSGDQTWLVAPQGGTAYYRSWTPGVEVRQAPEGWVLYRQDGGRDFFDPQGRLLRRETAEGQITRLTRDAASGRLTRIEDPAGRALTLDYDPASGHLRAVIDPAGERIAYTYDAAHRLTQVDYPDAHSRRYHYEDSRFPHALTGITDETGTRFSTYTYDAAGRAATSEHAGGVERITLNYSTASGGVTTTVSDGLNQQRIYTYAYPPNSPITITRQCPDCGSGLTRSYSYYSDNLPASLRNERGITTTYSYDLTRYLETSRTEASGTPQARILTTQWHPTFRRPARITAPNQRTDFTYNAQGQVLTRTETALDTGAARTWSYTYDASGRLTQSDGPRTDINDLTTYRYDNSGDLIQITNALGHVTQITQRDAHGRPLTVVDPNGVTTTLAYDPRGRLVRHTVADATTTYHYDAAGQITRLTLPDGATLNYTYDAAHRLTELSDALGHRLTYTLDVQGNRIQETLHDPNGVLTHTRARAYNSLNRLIQDIDAAGNRTTYAYDATGNLTRTTDALNRTTDTGYDALDRLIQVTDPNRGLTRYHYDAQSHLTGITDPKGLATTYTPDGLGQRVRQTSPDTGLATTTYDAAGNRLTQTDARGVTATYRYDALNRPVSLSYPDHRLNITFTYDEGIYGIGRLTGMNDGSGSTRYTYTARSQRLSETRTQDGHTFTTTYTYDAADRLIQITYPSGRTVHYARDDAGRIRAVRTQQGGPVTVLAETLAYLPFGPMQSLTYGNGLTLTRTFDQNYRLTAQTLGAIQNITYRYDAVGHLTQIIPADPSRHQTFGYDALDRLTAAQGIYGHLTYTYDPVGNRLTQTRNGQTDTYAYPAASHRLTGISGPQARSYTYDAAGNATQAGGLQLHYGDHNRLTRLTAAAATADYRYDGHGQRVAKTLNGQTTSFHYDPAGHLIAESNAQGLPLREYVYLDDLPLALLTSGQTYFIHPDHLGTPQVLTDAAQQVAWSADYQPFGELVRTSAAVDHPLRFPGQYYDEESGLHYNTFRDYDPGTGRYVQSDPIGLAGGVNTYAYVENNPVNWADPKGLSSTIIPWAGQTVRPLPITPYDPALPLPVPDIEYIPGGPHKDPFGEECQSLARRIKNTRDEIYNKRYPDLDSNPRNLPSRIGPGEKLEETVRGHKKLLDRRLRELRELEDEYGRKCVPLACLQ